MVPVGWLGQTLCHCHCHLTLALLLKCSQTKDWGREPFPAETELGGHVAFGRPSLAGWHTCTFSIDWCTQACKDETF